MKTNFFTSGWEFDEEGRDLRSKFQMINIAIILSTVSLLYGIIGNIVRDVSGLIPIELFLVGMNIFLFFLLRKCKKTFPFVTMMETLQFTVLFLFLIYTTEPSELKHIWVFTYPLLLLYFQNENNAYYWVLIMIVMLMIAPIQPYIDVQYSMYQVSYISFVVGVISVIIYFYQKKMTEAKELILKQQKIMNAQSKHAVMGEMISMIAHQWRQPLSTVTLSISNLQIKRLLGEKFEDTELDKALEDISDTVVYLSDTIDDFQTFFNPNREMSTIEVDEIISRALSFAVARLKNTTIEIIYNPKEKIIVHAYINELVQVILNILNNAIDELISSEIKHPRVVVKVEDQKSQVRITIEDNAGGIEEENLERIFEPYFSTKGKNGTGLGLYMSQMIMQKQFNTKIDVTNSKNGACFAIIVPKKLV